MYVVDPQGKQIARFRGVPDEVDLSDELMARSLGLYGSSVLRDHLVVHNHPVAMARDGVSSFPPSPTDVLFAIERDLREIVIVSGDQRYAVRRPGENWPTDEHELSRIIGEIGDLIDQQHGTSDNMLAARVRRFGRILRRLTEEGWIDYESSI